MATELLGAKRNVTTTKGGSFQDNGATVVLGGTTSTAVTSVPSTSILGFHTANYGNTVKVASQEGTATVSNATGIANQVAGKYSIQVISSSLLGGANQPETDIGNYKVTGIESLLQSQADWSYSTGNFLTTPSVSVDSWQGIIQGGGSKAFFPTRKVPNYVRQMTGSLVPTKTAQAALTD